MFIKSYLPFVIPFVVKESDLRFVMKLILIISGGYKIDWLLRNLNQPKLLFLNEPTQWAR